MIQIEDKTINRYGGLVKDVLGFVFSFLPQEDLKGIEKILLLDECPDQEYKWSGGFYCAAREDRKAFIELYPPKIINAKPFFFPKTKFSISYSITKMFLHELGHHKYGISNLQERELKAQEYMLFYIKKIYGNWIYFFDFLAKIDCFLRLRKKK